MVLSMRFHAFCFYAVLCVSSLGLVGCFGPIEDDDSSPGYGMSCSDGTSLSSWQVCDGVSNCPDGSDELGCTKSPGTTGTFCCGTSCITSIPESQVCDGSQDCYDGSDEAGCGNEPQDPQEPQGTLAAAAIIVEPKNVSGGDEGEGGPGTDYDLHLGFVVIDGDGSSVDDLEGSAFAWQDPQWTSDEGIVFDYRPFEGCTKSVITSDGGDVSVALVMDQSGSIASTDPDDARLSGAKEFLQSLNPADEAALISFASGGSCSPHDITKWGTGFTTDHASFFSAIDDFATCEDGGTPLYDACLSSIDLVRAEGGNAAKALVVFSDGQDTASAHSAGEVIASANGGGAEGEGQPVRVFNIGLSDNVDHGVLAQISQKTKGAYFPATSLGAMISAFRGMNLLLSGEYTVYDCPSGIHVTYPPGYNGNLDWLSTWVDVHRGYEIAKAHVFVDF